jgi:IS1 transposase
LWVSKHVGAREKEDWLATMYDMDSRLDHAYPLPLIVSDNWDPINDAIDEVYGIEYLPVSRRRGRPYSSSRFVRRPDLKYAQVMKVRDEHGNLKAIETRIVHGDPVDVRASLILSGSRNISTSSIERQNLSVRNYGKRFARKTICFSRNGECLEQYMEVLQAWFNFTKPHRNLRLKNHDGQYTHRTPAMAQGLAAKRLNWEEILRWRCN